jgi:hypothetical protein
MLNCMPFWIVWWTLRSMVLSCLGCESFICPESPWCICYLPVSHLVAELSQGLCLSNQVEYKGITVLVYRVWYNQRFWVSTGGLGTYTPWMGAGDFLPPSSLAWFKYSTSPPRRQAKNLTEELGEARAFRRSPLESGSSKREASMLLGMWKHKGPPMPACGARDGDARFLESRASHFYHAFSCWQTHWNTGQEIPWSYIFSQWPLSTDCSFQSSWSLSSAEALVLKNNWLFLTVQHPQSALQALG